MKKIQCQERKWVMTPPIAGPIANPMELAAVRTPIETPSIFAGRYLTQIIGVEAAIIEAPIPWKTREMMRSVRSGDNPQTTEPSVNRMKPAMKRIFTYPRSASFPKMRMRPASVRR